MSAVRGVLTRQVTVPGWRSSAGNQTAAVLLAGAVLCALASLGTRLLGIEPFVTLFAVTSEQNVPTWYAVALLTATAVAMVAVGALTPRADRRTRTSWFVVAAVLVALSVDELASLHERLGAYGAGLVGDAGGLLHFAWVVPGALVALVPVTAVLVLARRLPRRVAVELVAGLGLFLAAAFGLEMVGGLVLDLAGDGHLYALTAAVEELVEMLGVVVMLHATTRMLVLDRSGGSVTVRFAPPAA